MRKLKILFLCTGNSCRSQMAEGWTRALKGDEIEAYSAGIETHGLNPNAVKVMAEAGIDISGHTSKNVETLSDVPFDYVVTVCGHANENPPELARQVQGEEAKLAFYRRVRDEIRRYVETLPGVLP